MSGKSFCFLSYGEIGDRVPEDVYHLGQNSDVPFERRKMMAAYAIGHNPIPYKYLGIGAGNTTDFLNPVAPPSAQSIVTKYFSVENPTIPPKLFSEFYRVEFMRASFLDNDGNYVLHPQKQVEIIWRIPPDGAIGRWRELGIFTGNATAELNTGVLVHYLTVTDWNKIPISFKDNVTNYHWRVAF